MGHQETTQRQMSLAVC